MMKKHWLTALLICVLCLLFSGCIVTPGGDSSSSGFGDSSSSGGIVPGEDSSVEDNSGYDLGEYENEIDEKWWLKDSSPVEKEEEDVGGETIPY